MKKGRDRRWEDEKRRNGMERGKKGKRKGEAKRRKAWDEGRGERNKKRREVEG